MPLDDEAKKTALRQLTTGMVIVGSKEEGAPLTLETLGWHYGG